MIKTLAYELRRHLVSSGAGDISLGHVRELIAAAFSEKSWAAFQTRCLLCDAEVGGEAVPLTALVAGRAVQLGHSSAQAAVFGGVLAEALRARSLAKLSQQWLLERLRGHPDGASTGADGQLLDEEGADTHSGNGCSRDELRQGVAQSSLLISQLEERARKDPVWHHLLAIVFRCERPNSYLYDEQRAGRELNRTEQQMVERYLQLRDLYPRYERHLRMAAEGGVVAAALECADVFGDPSYLHSVEASADPSVLTRAARFLDGEARLRLLRKAAQSFDPAALKHLADAGSHDSRWALVRLGELGDREALHDLAEGAIEEGDAQGAWNWQMLAQHYNLDLTDSRARAYRHGGSHTDEEYDDDVGGPLYVLDRPAVRLPDVQETLKRQAQRWATEVSNRVQSRLSRDGQDSSRRKPWPAALESFIEVNRARVSPAQRQAFANQCVIAMDVKDADAVSPAPDFEDFDEAWALTAEDICREDQLDKFFIDDSFDSDPVRAVSDELQNYRLFILVPSRPQIAAALSEAVSKHFLFPPRMYWVQGRFYSNAPPVFVPEATAGR